MRLVNICTILVVLAVPSVTHSASPEDLAAIKATALDYAEGWYTGDAARMEKALSPDLAKRVIILRDGKSKVENMTAMGLVQSTRAGHGTKTPKDQQQADVTILDVFGNAASVKLVMSGWIDYLHIGKVNGQWVIINVLWELKPQPAK